MASQPQSGIACKTCRRRGRKCDRALPKCMSCHGRGVECEGYPLRWVGLAARGRMATVQSYQSMSNDSQYSGPANCTSSAWKMPAILLPPDGLQVFIKYCKDRSSRRDFAITHGLQTNATSVQPSIWAMDLQKPPTRTISYRWPRTFPASAMLWRQRRLAIWATNFKTRG